jgi:hypothetical protein
VGPLAVRVLGSNGKRTSRSPKMGIARIVPVWTDPRCDGTIRSLARGVTGSRLHLAPRVALTTHSRLQERRSGSGHLS